MKFFDTVTLPASKHIRFGLLGVAVVMLSGLMVPVLSSPAEATMASPPTCFYSRINCTRCFEREIMPDGSQRCVKCGRIPGCRLGRAPWQRWSPGFRY
jgi:hypothetical protein